MAMINPFGSITNPLPLDNWNQEETFKPLTNENTVGVSNLLSIAWLSRGLELASPVGRIRTPDGPATGFLIGIDLFLTNNHVIPNASAAAVSTVEFNYQTDWNGRLGPIRRFQLDGSRLQTNAQLDYTIIGVAGNPGEIFGYVDLNQAGTVSVNDYVTIIQHPLGGLKQICLTDNKVARVSGHIVQYTTDTEPGSSGSPVFNQSWQLVALHHAGGIRLDEEGKRNFINEGINIDFMLRDARAFLGLVDVIYTVVFGDLRAELVKFIRGTQAIADVELLASELVRKYPSFTFALTDWVKLNRQNWSHVSIMTVGCGVAVGAAILHWSRSSGHESITEVVASEISVSEELRSSIRMYRGSSKLPSDVYSEVLKLIHGSPTLVDPVAQNEGNEELATVHAKLFLGGVLMGAQAYGPPT